MTSAALLIPADRPEPAIKANAAPGTNSPAPLFPLASDGRPRTLSADAGGAKMRERWLASAGRAASGRVSYAKSAQAVTNSTMGRAARSGRTPFPAPRRATPLVVGARVRRSPLRKGQNLACALRENANRAPASSHPSGASPRPDGIGARLSGFLPLLAAPRHLLMQDNRISPSNARLKHRQEPGRVRRVVVSVIPFRIATSHARNKAWRSRQHVQKIQDDSIADLEREAARLASQIAARKQARAMK